MSTSALGLPTRRRRSEQPFWHRPAPAVAVVRLDPDFAALRSAFPRAWEALVSAKYALDALATMARTPRRVEHDDEEWSRPLIQALVGDLFEVARQAPEGLARWQAEAIADAAHAYARSGVWTSTELEPPRPDEPWMHCGPLRPWAMQDCRDPLALLVGQPQRVAQHSIDRITNGSAGLRATVGQVLGSPVVPEGALPEMFAIDLLLVGGSAGSGHKNFAHFFPLESPAGSTPQGDFTTVFSNVHLERLTRCSLPLLAAVSGRSVDIDARELLCASLAWFRSHDLAHFWKTDQISASEGETLGSFEKMVLNEALADTLGLLSVADMVDPGALGVAFSCELLRYLSRNHHEFADTTAAALEVGWLTEEADLAWAEPRRWLADALPSVAGLARTIRAAFEGAPEARARLRGALDTGRHFIARWQGVLAHVPTDLEYSGG